MWLELAGGGAAWLAHLLWYVTARDRAEALHLRRSLRVPTVVTVVRFIAALLLVLGVACWVRAHGPALGGCAAFAAVMAAASVNTIVAPLSLRSLAVSGALATGVLLLGTWEWLRGA